MLQFIHVWSFSSIIGTGFVTMASQSHMEEATNLGDHCLLHYTHVNLYPLEHVGMHVKQYTSKRNALNTEASQKQPGIHQTNVMLQNGEL